MISAVSLRSMLVKDFWCVCSSGLFLLPAAAVAARVFSRCWCKPSSCCTLQQRQPTRTAVCSGHPTDRNPRVARPGCVRHGGHLGLQWCNVQKEKTRPPAFSSATWAGEGDHHEPIAWQGPEDHAKLHSCIAPAPVSCPPHGTGPLQLLPHRLSPADPAFSRGRCQSTLPAAQGRDRAPAPVPSCTNGTKAFPSPTNDSSSRCSTAGQRQAGQRRGCHPDQRWVPSP